jgi:hypothetical protein
MEMSCKFHAPPTSPPEKEPPVPTHWIGGWMGPRTGLDEVAKIKKSLPLTENFRLYLVLVGPRNAYKILMQNLKERYYLGKTKVDRKIILKCILKEILYEDVNWVHLAQVRVQWWAPVNTVMNIRVPCKAGNFLTR